MCELKPNLMNGKSLGLLVFLDVSQYIQKE